MPVVLEDLDLYLPVTLHKPDLTEEEWFEFCAKYGDFRIEYSAEGNLILMPGTDFLTSVRNSEITSELRDWARRDARGKVTESSGSYLLPNGARRSPDAAWISNERGKARLQSTQKIPVMVPEFVIELKSSHDSRKKLHEKMAEWIDNGVELAWAIDPERKQVTIYRPNQMPESLENADTICGEGPVAGFLLDLTLIWNQA